MLSSASSSHPWQDALTRRLRALIRTVPLHRIEATKGHRSEELSEHDLRALALRVLDIVIEKMGLGTGALMEELHDGLRPLISSCEPDLGEDEARAIADTVVLAMLNEPDRRQAFAEPYLQVATDGTSRRVLQFHLLRERETADGHTVVVATVEGINLYAGMLDYPVEDAQIAEEAVLQAQVQRGRIADAVQTARRARLRSIEYEQKVVGLLETVRRDVQQVDWVDEVLTFLEQARTHVGERLHVEREIRRAVEDRLDVASDEGAAQLVDLSDTLAECIARHTRLHGRLIGANRIYLEEQERQAFRPRAAERLPDLEADVLRRAVALPASSLAALADPLLAFLQAPRAPSLPRLGSLVERLLAPRRADREDPYDLSAPDLEALPEPARSFTTDDAEAAAAVLAETSWPTSLGPLLTRARQRGLSDPAVRLLALRVLRAFDPSAENADHLVVTPLGERIAAVGFDGDELALDRVPAT